MALGFMRRHKRYLYVFLWLVVLAFIALYIPAFTKQDGMAGSPSEEVAEVGGVPITVAEFDQQYRFVKQRYEQMYQGRLDPAMLAQMGLENQVLSSLVDDRLVALEAERLGITVSDEEVARRIANSPNFQRNGKFLGAVEIRRLLALRGMTEEQFTRDFRQGILGEKLRSLLTDGVMVTAADVEREYRSREEQVKLEYVKVEAEPLRAEASVSDDEVRARFEAQKETYRFPEKRVVSYVLVDSTALEPRVTVTDAEIDAHYRERQDDFREPEQVCASHILVKVKLPESKEGHDEAEARKIAQGLLDQVKAGGDFAALAKKHSEDAGSASQGGDLRCFERGSMVPEFDGAAFGMKAGETSDLVKSSHGFHIIRVASHKEEQVPALSQVKERIRLGLRQQKVHALTEQKTAAVADALTRGKSMEDAAREQELTVQRSAPLSRSEPTPPLQSPALLARVFTLKRGETAKEPFNVGRAYAFVSLLDIQPSRLPELKEVQDRVKRDLTTEKAMEAARAKAEELHAQAEKDGLDKAAVALKLVRKETPTMVGRGQPLAELGTSAALEEVAYSLEVKALSPPVKVADGWAVVRVLEKKAFDPAAFAAQKDSVETTLREQKRDQLYRAYLGQARERFPVSRRPAVIARVVGGGREL
jgi:peptidyl-prolyl cis-trans isomerase D